MLVVAGLCAGLVLSEIAYRAWIFTRYKAALPTFYVFDKANRQFDREFGFSYISGVDARYVFVAEGLPASLTRMRGNSTGNVGREPEGYENAALKILVFGDSYTATGHGPGITWPDILQDLLARTLGTSVSVVNFGRDGYGILQMFDLAAAQVQRLRPDFVVVAFITDDLDRSRSWWLTVDGGARMFRFDAPPEQTTLRYALDHGVEGVIIDPRISEDWFQRVQQARDRNDPLLRSLIERRENFRPEGSAATAPSPFNLKTSYLFNRIVRGTPFSDSSVPRSNVRFRLNTNDLRTDQRFAQSVRRLRTLGVPYVLVHLPVSWETSAGQYRLSNHQRRLLESLTLATGKEPIGIIDLLSGHADPRELYMLPDYHASAKGNEHFAKAVHDSLVNGGIAKHARGH